jgi:hypothetical protein
MSKAFVKETDDDLPDEPWKGSDSGRYARAGAAHASVGAGAVKSGPGRPIAIG